MKRTILALAALMLATMTNLAWANCTTQTFIIDGKMTICTTCCYYGNCTTNCY